MKKFLTLLFLFAVSSLCFGQTTSPNWANKKGRFGIGADVSLGYSNSETGEPSNFTYKTSNGGGAVNLRYFLLDDLIINGGFGVMSSKRRSESDFNTFSQVKTTGTIIKLGVQAPLIKLGQDQSVTISPVLGVDIFNGTATSSVSGFDDREEDFTSTIIGLGLRGEYFPTQYLSLFAESGIRISFFVETNVASLVNQTEGDFTEGGVIVFGVADTFGNAGFTFWFK